MIVGLVDERPWRRFVSLWALGVVLNLVAWSVGHFLVPEGAFRGLFPGGDVVPRSGGVEGVLQAVLVYNLLLGCGLVVLANLFRVGRYPLGYLPVLFHWGMYGLFLGTNSFDVVRARPTAPSPLRLLRSTGFMEITAYTLVAVATVGLYLYPQSTLLQWSAERVRSLSEVRLRRSELAGLALALALILAAAWREAASILS